ncbi:glycosyltransferase family 2 protein [Sphingomicrobium nitratireducens]|uniref:glycosyltransferase family 2 protein n=1 Tax=Sphingomicrobium nitratireducens TaxID=2964666 RepID=UPI00223F3A65|nr:glycosyltransferase family 2 protein [Sphingomicrobium nitratireducens]
MELSIIVPVKDEEASVARFVDHVVPILEALDDPVASSFEIIFVDDGSGDDTLPRLADLHARDARVKAISLSRNFGKEGALAAGIEHSRGRAVIPIDVDLQDDPKAIPAMISKWREGADIVYGIRANREADSFSKRMTADLYYRTHNMISSEKIPMHAGDYRLMDRKVIDVLRSMPERNRFMRGLSTWAGFREEAVEFVRPDREEGESKYNYRRMWMLAMDGITSSSTLPLRVWSFLGAGIATLTLLYAAFIVVRTLIFGRDVPGYASLMVAVLFFGSIQLISLGVLGEYVGRILVETRRRPLYIVREGIGIDLDDPRVARSFDRRL